MQLEDEKNLIMNKLKSEKVANFLSKYNILSMLTFGSLLEEFSWQRSI